MKVTKVGRFWRVLVFKRVSYFTRRPTIAMLRKATKLHAELAKH
jgi:hypothetical protein